MYINGINNLYNTAFAGAKDAKKVARTPEEHFNHFTELIFNHLYERSQREVPENGKFTPLSASYNIPNTNNRAMLSVEYDLLEPKTQRRIFAIACRKDSDKIVKSQLFKGSKSEILAYLNDNTNREKFINTAKKLSDSLDSKE